MSFLLIDEKIRKDFRKHFGLLQQEFVNNSFFLFKKLALLWLFLPFIQSLGKLDNQNFTNNAPAKVVELERKKQTDAEAKIKAMELQLGSF